MEEKINKEYCIITVKVRPSTKEMLKNLKKSTRETDDEVIRHLIEKDKKGIRDFFKKK